MTPADLIAHAEKLRPLHDMRCTGTKHANPKQRHVECVALDLADALRAATSQPGLFGMDLAGGKDVTVVTTRDAATGDVVRCETVPPYGDEVPQ